MMAISLTRKPGRAIRTPVADTCCPVAVRKTKESSVGVPYSPVFTSTIPVFSDTKSFDALMCVGAAATAMYGLAVLRGFCHRDE